MPSLSEGTVLVLGAWGLVGRAICQEILRLNPRKLVVCSLLEHESLDAVAGLQVYIDTISENNGFSICTELVSEWGDIFARTEHKNILEKDVNDPNYLDHVISDTFDDLSKMDLSKNFLYSLIQKHKPDIVIDSVNTATGVAYQDIYRSVINMRLAMKKLDDALGAGNEKMVDAARNMLQTCRKHLACIPLPLLIRHVQVIYKAMELARTGYYIKIGTTGTGGMGMNIPYTHSEEKPSQVLLSKSAAGGAHSLLLYLMSKTPEMAHTKEFKPAAAIAWKQINYGEIKRKGKPIPLYDNVPDQAFDLQQMDGLALSVKPDGKIVETTDTLKAVYIDTGENGVFSAGEFSAITTTGQMEYITPQEIACMVVEELRGGNSGYDIMSNLSNAVMRSTYRAGFMRQHAVTKMRELEKEHSDDSVAFEILGPPRLSKLLFEAYLLRKVYGTPDAVIESTPEKMTENFCNIVTKDETLRRRILSIGLAILMPDGQKVLRGPTLVIPPHRGNDIVEITPENLDHWCHDGWIDLRPSNMKLWQDRMTDLQKLISLHDWDSANADTSSAFNRKDFIVDGKLNIGEVVGWIFNNEEKGARKFYAGAVPILDN